MQLYARRIVRSAAMRLGLLAGSSPDSHVRKQVGGTFARHSVVAVFGIALASEILRNTTLSHLRVPFVRQKWGKHIMNFEFVIRLITNCAFRANAWKRQAVTATVSPPLCAGKPCFSVKSKWHRINQSGRQRESG